MTIKYIIPEDGYIFKNGDNYADKIFLGKNDNEENYEQIELTQEILKANSQMYRKYKTGDYYEEGAHIIYGNNLVTIKEEIISAETELTDEQYEIILSIAEEE